jgi:polysaccharide biosynthesis transport protein
LSGKVTDSDRLPWTRTWPTVPRDVSSGAAVGQSVGLGSAVAAPASLAPGITSLVLPPPEAALEAAIDLQSILRTLLPRWKMILAMPVLTLLATYGVLKVIPTVYQSTAGILVFDPHREGNSAIQKTESTFVNSQALNTEIELLKSRSLLLRVAKELHLDEDPEFQAESRLLAPLRWLGLRDTNRSDGARKTATDDRIERAAAALDKSLQVEQVNFSYVLGLTVDSQSPQMSQRLAATIAADYLDAQQKARVEKMQQVADWLRSQLDELQARVSTTETAIEKLKAKAGFTDAGPNSNVSELRISDLNSQLQLARADVVKTRAAFEQARRVIESHGDVTDIPEVTASTFIGQLRQQRSSLVRQQADLRSTPGGRDVGVIVTSLANLDEAIRSEAAHIVNNMKNAHEAAVQREQSQQESLQRLTDALGNSPDYVPLKHLERVAKADRQLYESYLTQFNEITTRQTFQNSSPQIISPATLPTAPSKPKRTLFYGFGGIAGLGLGLLLAFVQEYLRPGVKTGAEVERAFGYPVLGIIPLVQPAKRDQPIEPGSLMQALVDTPLSPVGDAVRAVHVRLRFSNSDRAANVILVTSAVVGEGKSAAAMLLAISSATSGQSAVLVDCDLHHCTVSKAFGMPEQGLADLLAGTAEINDVIIPGPAANTHVIPAGSTTGSPTDLLTSQRIGDLIAQLRERYDCVVLDTSPVLAVVDALALAGMVDKIVVIVEWNRTPRDVVAEAFKALRRDGHRIAGVVLNKVDLKQLRAYDYSHAYTYPYPYGNVEAPANRYWRVKSRNL